MATASELNWAGWRFRIIGVYFFFCVLIGAGLLTAGAPQAVVYPIAFGLSLFVPPILLWRMDDSGSDFKSRAIDAPSVIENRAAGLPAHKSLSVLITCSSVDRRFALRLHSDLRANLIRCWFAPEEEEGIERLWESIHLHANLLVIVSAKSISSNWVKKEMSTALEDERAFATILPVCLDDDVMECAEQWAAWVRNRPIADFRNWRNSKAYQLALDRLLRRLRAEEA